MRSLPADWKETCAAVKGDLVARGYRDVEEFVLLFEILASGVVSEGTLEVSNWNRFSTSKKMFCRGYWFSSVSCLAQRVSF